MENYCKNCGAHIKDNARFCQECGKEVENVQNLCPNCGEELDENAIFCAECGTKVGSEETEKLCPNCGESIVDAENFCENCGTNLNAPQVVKKNNFIEQYKLPLMVALLVFIILVSIPVSTFILNESAGPQVVNVDSFDFKIPDNFNENNANNGIDPDYPGVSKHWENGDDYIEIWVMTPNESSSSAEYIVSSVGGALTNKYGYTGYLNDFTEGGAAFSYIRNGKVIHIIVSDERLFDKIEVL